MSSTGGLRFSTKTQPYPTDCRLHSWNASGQITSKKGTQPHPSAERLSKIILSAQPHQNRFPYVVLPTRGTRQLQPPEVRQQSLPPGILHKPLNQPHQPGDRHQKQKELQSHSLQDGCSKSEKNEMTEKYVVDEGAR